MPNQVHLESFKLWFIFYSYFSTTVHSVPLWGGKLPKWFSRLQCTTKTNVQVVLEQTKGKILEAQDGKERMWKERWDGDSSTQNRVSEAALWIGHQARDLWQILNFAMNLPRSWGATGSPQAAGDTAIPLNDNSPGMGEAGVADPSQEVGVSWAQVGLTPGVALKGANRMC